MPPAANTNPAMFAGVNDNVRWSDTTLPGSQRLGSFSTAVSSGRVSYVQPQDPQYHQQQLQNQYTFQHQQRLEQRQFADDFSRTGESSNNYSNHFF